MIPDPSYPQMRRRLITAQRGTRACGTPLVTETWDAVRGQVGPPVMMGAGRTSGHARRCTGWAHGLRRRDGGRSFDSRARRGCRRGRRPRGGRRGRRCASRRLALAAAGQLDEAVNDHPDQDEDHQPPYRQHPRLEIPSRRIVVRIGVAAGAVRWFAHHARDRSAVRCAPGARRGQDSCNGRATGWSRQRRQRDDRRHLRDRDRPRQFR
jgi:hypothetical protein